MSYRVELRYSNGKSTTLKDEPQQSLLKIALEAKPPYVAVQCDDTILVFLVGRLTSMDMFTGNVDIANKVTYPELEAIVMLTVFGDDADIEYYKLAEPLVSHWQTRPIP